MHELFILNKGFIRAFVAKQNKKIRKTIRSSDFLCFKIKD